MILPFPRAHFRGAENVRPFNLPFKESTWVLIVPQQQGFSSVITAFIATASYLDSQWEDKAWFKLGVSDSSNAINQTGRATQQICSAVAL